MINFVKTVLNINGDGSEEKTFKFYEEGFELNGSIGESYQDVTVLGKMSLTLLNAKADSLNYLKAFGKCEQRRLPEGYTELEYLGFTGTQYIQTNISIQNVRRVVGGVSFNSATPADLNYVAGVRNGSATALGFGILAPTRGGFTCYPFEWKSNDISYAVTAGEKINFDTTINETNTTFKVNGTTRYTGATTSVSSAGFTGTNTITIGAIMSAPTTGSPSPYPQYTLYGKVFNIKMYNGSNNLIFNGVPAKNSSNVLGMYDTVSETFLTNAGTGTFTAGAEAVPTPTQPLPIICNNGELKVRNKSGLPLGYQAVEYLESTGTQYIETDEMTVNDQDTVNFDYEYTDGNTSARVMSFDTAQPSSYFNYTTSSGNTSTGNVQYGFGTKWYNGPNVQINTLYKTTFYNRELTINNVQVSVTGADFTSITGKLNIFRGYFNNWWTYTNAKVYKLSITEKLNLIPCRRKSDNVLGMYDTVNDTFYTNAGTGTFTAGADIDDMEIYIDGTQETINVHGKNLFDKNDSDIGDGYISAMDGSVTTSSRAHTGYFKVIPNTTYHVTLPTYQSGSSNGIAFYNSSKTYISGITSNVSYGVEPHTFTVPSNNSIVYTRLTLTDIIANTNLNEIQIEQGSTATTYEPYFNGGTATAENLLSVSTYKDVQSILDGGVTRNVGVKVLTGDEDWVASSVANLYSLPDGLNNYDSANFQNVVVFCTHFVGVLPTTSGANMPNYSLRAGGASGATEETRRSIYIKYAGLSSANDFKQWLATQYANGTPVIIVYPTNSPTTETVTPQPLTIQEGTNIIEVTQSSIDDLELEAQYKAGVGVTIAEIQNVNLDNSVTVTIS